MKHLRPKVEERSMAFAVGREAMYRTVTNAATPVVTATREGNVLSTLRRAIHALGYIMSVYQDTYNEQIAKRGNMMQYEAL